MCHLDLVSFNQYNTYDDRITCNSFAALRYQRTSQGILAAVLLSLQCRQGILPAVLRSLPCLSAAMIP